MTIIIPNHDETSMPIRLGSVLRTPHEDWHKYGIRWDTPEELGLLVDWGRGEYVREWGHGDPTQIDIVAEASKKAFGGNDNNQILREKTGEVVAKHLEMQTYDGKREFYVLDVGAGAGASFLAFLDKLPTDFKGEVKAILLDPARNPLRKTGKAVRDRGIKYVKTIDGRQDQIPELVPRYVGKNKKMSAVLQVGSIHHDCKIPFENFYGITENGGLFASGDWHPQTWQDPAHVLAMLETNWPDHEQVVDNFKETYGVRKSKLPDNPEDRKACLDIFNFWKAYHEGLIERGRGHGSNSIWPLESHQDYRRYLEKMEKAGYITDPRVDGYLRELFQEANVQNPGRFYDDSTIIMFTGGRRPLQPIV